MLYSVDTKAFYTNEEQNIMLKIYKNQNKINYLKEYTYLRLVNEYDENLKNIIDKLTNSKIEKVHKILDKYTYDTYVNIREVMNNLKYKYNGRTKEEESVLKELEDEFKTLNRFKLTGKESKYILKILRSEKNELFIESRNNIKELNAKLREEMKKNFDTDMPREIITDKSKTALTESAKVSLFESYTVRTMDLKIDELTTDLIIVTMLHYDIMEQLITKGFTYKTIDNNGKEIIHKYRVFTSSAGQIRKKKVVFIKENLWNKYEKTFMCGLTISDINNSKEHGCNINKFLAYLALGNSATDKWEGFDIDKCIVIEDFETNVLGEVDYIDNVTFDVKRTLMEVPIPHSDGCGWILSKVSKKNFMVRLPWVKGLLTPCDYIKFCKEYNGGISTKITDIYGKEWDLEKDNIQVVFSKSQFKMWKYYPNIQDDKGNIIEYGWDTYKNNFKKYNCHASICNLEPDSREFRQANFNYQMWQTLTDITDDEIKYFTEPVNDFITKAYTDKVAMLKMLGADKNNKNKNYLQETLSIYPELLRDYHVKEELSSQINARKKEAKYGKFKINATYTFLIPDIYAWMEYSLAGIEKPKGLLKNKEVCCKLFKNDKELLVDRSPHLYREHALRNNIINNDTDKWFITDGIYTSTHDLISKLLQFDTDGDKSLVSANKILNEVVKRNMEGIVPLYYEMGKAKPKIINSDNIYESLTQAFKYGNIGEFSNTLTSLWNEDNPDLQLIKQITALNNFSIDAAKTLEMPEPPDKVKSGMNKAKKKMPYFFQFAKDKDAETVLDINNSTVNRICRNIENIKQGRYDFNKAKVGRFRRDMLMNNSKIEVNKEVIDLYKKLNKGKKEYFYDLPLYIENKLSYVNTKIRTDFEEGINKIDVNISDAIDMIIKYIYTTNRTCKKSFLFDVFGDVIVNNLKENLKKYKICEVCHNRFESNNNNAKYCINCAKEIKQEQKNKWKREKWNKEEKLK